MRIKHNGREYYIAEIYIARSGVVCSAQIYDCTDGRMVHIITVDDCGLSEEEIKAIIDKSR